MLAAALAMGLFVGPHGAIAQSAPPKPNKNSSKTDIDAYIGYEIPLLNSDDITVQQKARDEIIAALTPAGAPGAAYYEQFDDDLNTQLSGMLLDPKLSIRAKICAGLICVKVATNQNAKDSAFKLEQADRQLLADPAPAVVAYGLKASSAIISAMLNNPAPPPVNVLSGAIIKAVKIDSPASMVDDAWHALTPDVASTLQLVMVPYVQQFLEERKDQYVIGAPRDPLSDSFGVLLLCSTWSQQNPTSRTASMQAISDLISVSGQRANTEAGAADLSGYGKMYDNIYKAFDQNKMATALQVAGPLKDMEMKVDKATIFDAATQVTGDLCKGSADWSPLQPAPQVVARPQAAGS
jgi:hypothetical protein